MAIIIPSANLYKAQNEKVLDNYFDRFERNGNEVLPDNNFETPVCNEKVDAGFVESEWKRDFKLYGDFASNSNQFYQQIGVVGIKTYNRENYKISVKKLGINNYISRVYTGLKTNDDGEEETYIKTNIRYYKYTGSTDVTLRHVNAPNIQTTTTIPRPIRENQYNITYGGIVYDSSTKEEKDKEKIEKNEVVVTEIIDGVGVIDNYLAQVEGEDKTNLYDVNIVEETDEEYIFNISVLCGYEKYYGKLLEQTTTVVPFLNSDHVVTCTAEKVIPIRLEITIYGNTIGIDLKEKTIYIPSTDKTSKKVLSFDSNELVQTSNYFLDTNENAVETMFGKTLSLYKNGKETATVRCSIGDYYKYDENSPNFKGDKVISTIEKLNMTFNLYDEVIPMVYSATGKDKPMSTYNDGTPKTFQVLGTKIYYDGVVWQELYLQELDKPSVK